jgi:nitrite reductase (NADH) large subunit
VWARSSSFERTAGQAWQRPGLRHLQAHRGQHLRVLLERVRAQEGLGRLQDSNDYFLGNIQKDGTYSVVPRMPAGEVTPDGLIAVGQVAKKYGLYTKVTGGQRVDLFGARVEQLPFDLGRTDRRRLRIRPCLWQVAAHREELCGLDLVPLWRGRQRGPGGGAGEPLQGPARPHKIKFGVSGCTRECAEAQGKDIGSSPPRRAGTCTCAATAA